MIMEQIREFFEVKTLEPTVKEIPADIDVLMLVQPTMLTDDAAYAIDQYALGGGRMLAFVDPHGRDEPSMGPPGMPACRCSAEFVKLLKAWGVDFDANKVVGDPPMRAACSSAAGRRGRRSTEYVGLAAASTRRSINEKDPLPAGIERLNLATGRLPDQGRGRDDASCSR